MWRNAASGNFRAKNMKMKQLLQVAVFRHKVSESVKAVPTADT
jgi:hypothetical protein